MKKVLYVHPEATARGVEPLAGLLARDGRFEVDATRDWEAQATLPDGDYAVIVLHAAEVFDALTPRREQGLLEFVRRGGDFVGLDAVAGMVALAAP